MPVKLANGQKIVIRNQTRTLQVAIGTPWGSVGIHTAFAVIPGNDNVMIIRSKTLRRVVIDRAGKFLKMSTTVVGHRYGMYRGIHLLADWVALEPAMFMEGGNEVIANRKALVAAVDAALEAGLPSDTETRLRGLLLGLLFDGFSRSLSEDPPARVEPFQVILKADIDLSKVKASTRVC